MTTRDKYLQRTYGISEAEYTVLLACRRGACWICEREPKPGKNLSVDHDHATARMTGEVRRSVRGLLCFICNKKLIGRNRREHADIYRSAAHYLESSLAQEVLRGGHVHNQETEDEPKTATRSHRRTRRTPRISDRA